MAAPLKKVLDSAVRIDPAIITSPGLAELEEINPKALHFIILVNQLVYLNSYFVILTDLQKKDMSEKLDITAEDLDMLLIQSCKKGFFNIYMYTRYAVLTNQEIQEYWLSKVRRRKNVQIYSKFLLIDRESVSRYITYDPNWIDEAEIPENHDFPVKAPMPKALGKNLQPPPNVPYEKPAEVPKAPEEGTGATGHVITFTSQELKEFVKIPYEDRPDIFKKKWSKGWYENYIEFANGMIKEGPHLMISDNQISLSQYHAIVVDLTKHGFKNPELLEIIDRILGSEPLKPGSPMFKRFMQFSKGYIEEKTRSQKKKVVKDIILHDGTK